MGKFYIILFIIYVIYTGTLLSTESVINSPFSFFISSGIIYIQVEPHNSRKYIKYNIRHAFAKHDCLKWEEGIIYLILMNVWSGCS